MVLMNQFVEKQSETQRIENKLMGTGGRKKRVG